MNRDDYLMRAYEFTPRGQALPQSKLTDEQVIEIRAAQQKRDDLRAHIREQLSNDALAQRMGVHVRTIEKVLNGGAWVHLLAAQPNFEGMPNA
jgi:predicted DNA-binding protein (UPF0251 family)